MRFDTIGKYVSLSQGMVVNKGTSHMFSETKDNDFVYPLLRIVDFESGNHEVYSKYVSKDVPEKVIIDERAILYTRVTCECFRGFRGVFHNNLFRVELISDELTEDYLYVVLQSEFVRKQAERLMSSSVVPDLTHDLFKQIVIPIPEKTEQEKIASLILSIDRRIQTNDEIYREQERLIRQIYDYWFLQFDFPGLDGKPYKSSNGSMVWNDELKKEIPEGWSVVPIGEHVKVNRGISYSSNDLVGEGVPMINLNSFNTDASYKADGLKSYSGTYAKEKIISPYDLLVCATQQTAIDLSGKTNVIGKALLVPDIFNQPVVASMDIIKLMCDETVGQYYMRSTINQPSIHKFLVGYANGTKIKHLDINGLLEMKHEIPPEPLLAKFNKVVETIERDKSAIIAENQELSKLREFIMPLLLNGQASL